MEESSGMVVLVIDGFPMLVAIVHMRLRCAELPLYGELCNICMCIK